MSAMYDGYQVFKVNESMGNLLPAAPCRGSFREAVEDKERLRKTDPYGIYNIHGIVNNNNSK